jgi:hypothetical protein
VGKGEELGEIVWVDCVEEGEEGFGVCFEGGEELMGH